MAYTKTTWINEILAAAARYDILTDVGASIYNNVQIDLSTTVSQAGTGLTASAMNNIEDWIDGTDTLLGSGYKGSAADLATRLAVAINNDGTLKAITSSTVSATTSAELAGVISDETGTGALMFATSPVITTDITIPNTGLHILDTNASHDLIIAPGSDLTADRTLTLTTGDAARTVTLSGNPTLADWFDQNVKQAASPTFAGGTFGANSGVAIVNIKRTNAGAAGNTIGSVAWLDNVDDVLAQIQAKFDTDADSGQLLLQVQASGGSLLTGITLDSLRNTTLSGDLAVNGGDITSTSALTLTPLAGQNLNVNLSTTGDFAVNTSQLYVDTSTGFVGIGTNAPGALLEINGSNHILLSGSSAKHQFKETDAAIDNKLWDWLVAGEEFKGRLVNDADTAATTWLQVNRTGTTVDNVSMPSGNVGIGISTGLDGKAHIDQASTTAAIPVLTLDQADVSEQMIKFISTIDVGNAIEAVGAKTLTTTHFIKVEIDGVGDRYIPVGTIA